MGAAHGVNYKTTPAWDEEVLKLTGRTGVDHILEVDRSQFAKNLSHGAFM